MNDLLNLVYVEGDPSLTLCNLLILVVVLEFIAGIFGLIGRITSR